jgi:hypothetical protein
VSYLLFIDESGHDQHDSPYEVLAGIVIQDRKLWGLINAVQQLELDCFGQRYAAGERELKGKKILKRKVFRHAGQSEPIPLDQRTEMARRCLADGASATRAEMAALGQAKIDFVGRALSLCHDFDCKAIASIVARGAPRPSEDVLRKDYAYLFERFFYFLENQPGEHQGLVVFDELERSQGHLLVDHMAKFSSDLQVGRERAERIIPEPFFVHSHLTTGVQLADLIAYIAAWGIQIGRMPPASRPELADLGRRVCRLEHHVVIEHTWPRKRRVQSHSLAYIDDLRTRRQRHRRSS